MDKKKHNQAKPTHESNEGKSFSVFRIPVLMKNSRKQERRQYCGWW